MKKDFASMRHLYLPNQENDHLWQEFENMLSKLEYGNNLQKQQIEFMGILADYLEDSGSPLVTGLRWMYQNNKYPLKCDNSAIWVRLDKRYKYDRNRHHYLPRQLFKKMRQPLYPGALFPQKRFSTVQQAMEELAQVFT